MKDNRQKWQFSEHPSKPVLTATEVRFWRNSFSKLLKVGIEFEFNLQKPTGNCKGNDIQCPCIHLEEGCWKECIKYKKCAKTPCYDTCKNQKAKCKPEDCKTCKNYKFSCLGVVCVEFVSVCFTCPKFDKNCETCSKKYDPKKDPKNIRQTLINELKPNQHYGITSKSGVVQITTDGSLHGDKGVEIITVGRRIDYWEFYKMCKSIIDKATKLGAYLNERTGSHMHVLASYQADGSINEMEKEMPEIILANLHQLCRRYQNAITWMTMALNDPNHMTRWEKFRVSVLDISPVRKNMFSVRESVAANSGGSAGGKYGWINYNKTRFNKEKDKITVFHIEMRAADSTLCPSWYAAIACMYYALVIKAVEISRYGLLNMGDDEWMEKTRQMKNVILNNCGDYSEGNNRKSDTSKVLDYRDYFIEESLDLVSQLKGILLKLGPAYDVLSKIATKPVALRLIEGEKWESIEKDLEVEINEANHIEIALDETVDLRIIEDCKTEKEWVLEVNKMLDKENMKLDITKEDIEKYIDLKTRAGEIVWSEIVGSMISV